MQQANEKIRIIVGDDHITVLEGLVAIINRQPDMVVVGQGANGSEVKQQWFEYRPDVRLIDLRMPEKDGIAVIEEVRNFDPDAKFLILTTYDTDDDIHRALKIGAKGYLLKDARREEILDYIRRIHMGETCVSAELTSKLVLSLSNEHLTKRELDVLIHIANGESNKVIARKLFISETTIKSHIRSIFLKFNVSSRTEAINAGIKRGLIRL